MNVNEVVCTNTVSSLHHRMDAKCEKYEVNNESHFVEAKQGSSLLEADSLTNDRRLSIRNVVKIINEHPTVIKALTVVTGAGAVASGAAAVGTSMTCASIGNAFAGVETACATLLGMGPVGWATVGLGLGAAAIGGAIYLLRKK